MIWLNDSDFTTTSQYICLAINPKLNQSISDAWLWFNYKRIDHWGNGQLLELCMGDLYDRMCYISLHHMFHCHKTGMCCISLHYMFHCYNWDDCCFFFLGGPEVDTCFHRRETFQMPCWPFRFEVLVLQVHPYKLIWHEMRMWVCLKIGYPNFGGLSSSSLLKSSFRGLHHNTPCSDKPMPCMPCHIAWIHVFFFFWSVVIYNCLSLSLSIYVHIYTYIYIYM